MIKVKNILIGFFVLFMSFSALAQSQKNNWTMGLGGSAILFSPKSKAFPSEVLNLQIPKVELTRYIKNGFSLNGGISIAGIDEIPGFIDKNRFDIVSIDILGRYDFKKSEETLVPYVAFGTGLVIKDWDNKAVVLGLGGGATYWLNRKIGLNAQLLYKGVPESYDKDFDSHIQLSGSVIFSFDNKDPRFKGNRSNSWRGGSGFCN